MRLVFTGIQWCGKGTQARLLVENHGYKLVEMGVEFRKVVKSGTELGKEVAEIIDNWWLVTEELGAKVMRAALENYTDDEKVIFDGFLRLPWNVEIFEEYISDYKVIFFNLDTEKAKGRLLGRMYDTETWETFPAGTITNPNTGTELIKREDDKDENAILARFDAFENDTLPIVASQRDDGKIIDVNADQAIDAVYDELKEKLWIH